MWSVFISNHFVEKPLTSSLPYIIVQVLASVIFPITLCAGIALLAIVVRFISTGQVDLRGYMAHINPAVVYTCGTDVTEGIDAATVHSHFFWVISDHFYAQVSHDHTDTRKDQLSYYIDGTPSTWVISGTILLSLLSAMIYFVHTTLVQSTVIGVPPKVGECDGANCYTNWNTVLVDCTDNRTYIGKSYLHCYSFSTDPKQSLWGSISIAFGVYGATVVVLKTLFAVAAMLHSILHSRAWGLVYILTGVLGIVVTVVFYFIPRLGSLHLDEVKAAHLIVIFIYAILCGVLLYLGSVKELITNPTKVKALSIQL